MPPNDHMDESSTVELKGVEYFKNMVMIPVPLFLKMSAAYHAQQNPTPLPFTPDLAPPKGDKQIRELKIDDLSDELRVLPRGFAARKKPPTIVETQPTPEVTNGR